MAITRIDIVNNYEINIEDATDQPEISPEDQPRPEIGPEPRLQRVEDDYMSEKNIRKRKQERRPELPPTEDQIRKWRKEKYEKINWIN